MSNSLKCNVKNVRVLFELKRSRRVMFLQTSRTFWLVFLYPQCVSVTDSCNALMFILHSVGAGVHIRHTFLDIAPLHTIHCTCRLRNLNRRCVLCYKQQVITCTSNPRQTFISFSILLLFSSFSRLPMHIICVCIAHTLPLSSVSLPLAQKRFLCWCLKLTFPPTFKRLQCYGWPPYEK